MNFGEPIRTCLSKYATFSGRASRSEYWYFSLFGSIVALASPLIYSVTARNTVGFAINVIINLVLLLPYLAVSVRRLHDIDRTGWWVLLLWIPFIPALLIFTTVEPAAQADVSVTGPWLVAVAIAFVLMVWCLVILFVLMVWSCRRGTIGPNRYGPDPLADVLGATPT